MAKRTGKIVGAVVASLVMLLIADYCRVQIGLAEMARQVRVGDTMGSVERKLGHADIDQYISFAHEDGVAAVQEANLLVYCRLYAWQYPLRYLPIGRGPGIEHATGLPARIPRGHMWVIEHAPRISVQFAHRRVHSVECHSPFYR